MGKIIFFLLLLAQISTWPDSKRLSLRIEEGPLQELLLFFKIPLEQTIPETQRLWLQKGKERWEFDTRYERFNQQIRPFFEKMGFFEEVTPLRDHYHYVLVHGGLLESMKMRIRFLEALIERGFQFDRIVFLTGARELLDEEKAETGLKTEGEMVRYIYENSNLLKSIPTEFWVAPMKENGGRPQTSDAISEWLTSSPQPGSCFAISSQPFVRYQDAVFQRLLSPFFQLETGGPAPRTAPSIDLLLDTLAKELFWLQP